MINKIRRLLIKFGKMLPFVLCFLVLVSYSESLYALYVGNILMYGNKATLYTHISYQIAKRFEYDLLTIFATTILSIAIETCCWNKLALLYLFIQLLEKSYFSTIELYPEYIYAICIANILICCFFCYKGITIFLKSAK